MLCWHHQHGDICELFYSIEMHASKGSLTSTLDLISLSLPHCSCSILLLVVCPDPHLILPVWNCQNREKDKKRYTFKPVFHFLLLILVMCTQIYENSVLSHPLERTNSLPSPVSRWCLAFFRTLMVFVCDVLSLLEDPSASATRHESL